jgi:hypothetical protein
MAVDGDTGDHQPEDEMLPDEAEVLVERADELADEDARLSVEEVADDLDIELD